MDHDLKLVTSEYRSYQEKIRAVEVEQRTIFIDLNSQKNEFADRWNQSSSRTKDQDSKFIAYLKPITEQLEAYTKWYLMRAEELRPISDNASMRDGSFEAEYALAVQARDEAKRTLTDRIPRLLEIMRLLSESVRQLCEYVGGFQSGITE
jgi:hypothetical protein